MIAEPKALESWMVARAMILVGLLFLPAWVWGGCGNQARPKALKWQRISNEWEEKKKLKKRFA